MVIDNVKRFRYFQDRTNMYLVDLNSYWWTPLVGLFNWNMKMKAYKIESVHGHKMGMIGALRILMGMLGVFFALVSGGPLRVEEARWNIGERLLIDLLILGILLFFKRIWGIYESGRMDRQVKPGEKVLVRLKFRKEKVMKKILFYELMTQGLLLILFIGPFLFGIFSEGCHFFNVISIYLFLYVGIGFKTPFKAEAKDLRYIEELGEA